MSKGCTAAIQLFGRIGRDATIRGNGERQVVAFPVAVTTGFNSTERTTWYDCNLWGNSARVEAVSQMVKKGRQVSIIGEPSLRTYDKDGVEKSVFAVDVKDLSVIVPEGERSAPRDDSRPSQTRRQQPAQEDYDDDVPF